MGRRSGQALLRRSRSLISGNRLWKPRLVFWAGALAIGLISAGFAFVADVAQHLFIDTVSGDGWTRFLPLALTPAGFIFCAWAAFRYVPGSQGSGIPQAIAARHLREDSERGLFLSLGMVSGKIFLTVVGLLCGASIGREGPTVQVGASIMLQVARWGGMAQARGLILAGSAAGIAAAFNTPLAGIVFAIEEMGRSYQARTNGVVLFAVILAGLASLATVGNYTYFGVTHASATFPTDWILVIACGVVGGAFGAGFSYLTLRITRRIRRMAAWTPTLRVIAIAGAAGLIVAILGVATNGMSYGTGYEQARSAIEGEALPWYYFGVKFIATLVSTVCGIPGGLFAPSLSVGAGLGSTIGIILGTDVALAALLGMAGYFSGVVQAPMTAFVIILEMTGNQANVLPLMAAAVVGHGVSRLISPQPLYGALSRLFIADVLRRRRAAAQQKVENEAGQKA
ncbi:MAG: chloride channel protein [Rhizobiaceae bacterium]|nr:chloride channel protein [Rhizobiaceae bacterium]